MVPWPVIVPRLAGANAPLQPAAPVMATASHRPMPAMTDREAGIRMSNGDARMRARKLIAVGDRYLRESIVERSKITRALSSYRRAAAVAADLPEVYVRQAIALVALGQNDDASRAIATVATIDPRLREGIADSGFLAIQQVWPAPDGSGGPSDPTANWIADRWSHRWHPEMEALADAAIPTER
jgi:hypothetical protein